MTRRLPSIDTWPGRAALVLFVTAAFLPAANAAPRAPTLDVNLEMPDGDELATSVWLPADDALGGPWPTLLRRTPYGRDLDGDFTHALNDLGYAVVSQDVRGRGDSEGDFLPFFPDRIDGPTTIAWIAAQPWANGRVGTWSGSAEGIVQFMALGEAPPALDCALVTMATEDVCDGMMPGGAWRTELTTAWMNGMNAQDALAQWRQHEACDIWWDPARLSDTEVARIQAPVLMVGGFYDIFARDMVRAFQRLSTGAQLDVRDHMFLVLGPWTHGTMFADDSGFMPEGHLTYPPDAGYTDYWADFIGFFAWCLQDAPRPTWAPVRYFQSRIDDDGTTASGTWWTARSWPPVASADRTSVTGYLGPDNVLWQSLPPGPLPPVELPVDPAAPVPSAGGGNLTTPAGPRDQAWVDQLDGVAVFETSPVEFGGLIEGNVAATIWASNTTEDVDVIVRLSQVTLAGRVLLLADGIRRGRYGGGVDAPVSLLPGVPTRFDVDLGPVSFHLPESHRLRIAISGTSSPRYEPNPGTAAPIADEPLPVASTLTIHLGGDTPSTITLPAQSDFLHLREPPEPVPDEALPDARGPDIVEDVPTEALAPDGTADAPPADINTECPPCRTTSGCTSGRTPPAPLPHLLLALSVLAATRLRRPRHASP